MASIKSRKTNLIEDDDYDESEESFGMSPSLLSDVLDVITALGRSKVCDDNPRSTLSSPTRCLAARMGLSKSDLLESGPSKNDKVLEPIRVEINTQGREKITFEFGDQYGEIFSVRIVDLGEKSRWKIHGEIMLRASLGKTYLFSRKRKDPLTIVCGDIIPLTGPVVATFPCEGFGVDIRLKEGGNDLCEEWLTVQTDFYEMNQNPHRIEPVTWSSGCVAVTYSIFDAAMLAEVEVKLIENKSTTKVWGTITASIGGHADLTSMIFKTNADECLSINPGGFIPLSRPLLSVPCSSYLLINVNLHDYAYIPNKPFTTRPLLFAPGYFGDYVGTLLTECGKIDVKVTWFSMRRHKKTMAALGFYPCVDVDLNPFLAY